MRGINRKEFLRDRNSISDDVKQQIRRDLRAFDVLHIYIYAENGVKIRIVS